MIFKARKLFPKYVGRCAKYLYSKCILMAVCDVNLSCYIIMIYLHSNYFRALALFIFILSKTIKNEEGV